MLLFFMVVAASLSNPVGDEGVGYALVSIFLGVFLLACLILYLLTNIECSRLPHALIASFMTLVHGGIFLFVPRYENCLHVSSNCFARKSLEQMKPLCDLYAKKTQTCWYYYGLMAKTETQCKLITHEYSARECRERQGAPGDRSVSIK